MVAILIPVLCGIASARQFTLPIVPALAAFAVCTTLAALLIRRREGTIYLATALLLVGHLLYTLHPEPLRNGFHATNRLHEAAVERLERLDLDPEHQALCNAMGAGDKTLLTPSLRRAYARTGTAHVLAVSGLHTGIVFLMVNALLWWLPLLRHGHLIRNLAVVAAVWLYAVAAGASPGTIRSAVMFTGLQAALATSSRYASANLLAAAALGMTVVRPAYLFDIGFQLSFVAVAAILAWGLPLLRNRRSRWRTIDFLWGTLVVSLIASTATAPLVSYHFGSIPLVGIAVNPLVILLAYGVVAASVLWMAVPWPPLAAGIRPLLESAFDIQQRIVEWAAQLPGAAVEYRMTAGQAAAVYLFLVGATLIRRRKKAQKTVSLQP